MSETVFNFHDTLLLATAFQSFSFILLILFAKRDLHISDYFLIGFFLAQTAIPLHLLISFGEEFRLIALASSPNWFRILDLAFWIEGPLLLWYTRSLLYTEFELERSDCLYLLPALAYLAYSLLTFFSWETAEKVAYVNDYHELIAPSLPHVLEAVRGIVFVVFGILALREILHAQQQTHDRYSNIEKINFVWLGALVAAFMILRTWTLLVVALAFVLPDLGPEFFNVMGLSGNYLMFAIICWLIFFSLTRASIFAGKFSNTRTPNDPQEYEVDPALTHKIELHMQENKPYLEHLLNLEQLANQLSLHPRALSLAIKHNFNTNFYEFINTYRIQEAKILIEDPAYPNRTMIDILGESGFNSKATFNAFFKKLEGMTPTQYRASRT
ncbi:MAG: helix-turn-helix transcriptional regulator [Pseudomonadota bacterium]